MPSISFNQITSKCVRCATALTDPIPLAILLGISAAPTLSIVAALGAVAVLSATLRAIFPPTSDLDAAAVLDRRGFNSPAHRTMLCATGLVKWWPTLLARFGITCSEQALLCVSRCTLAGCFMSAFFAGWRIGAFLNSGTTRTGAPRRPTPTPRDSAPLAHDHTAHASKPVTPSLTTPFRPLLGTGATPPPPRPTPTHKNHHPVNRSTSQAARPMPSPSETTRSTEDLLTELQEVHKEIEAICKGLSLVAQLTSVDSAWSEKIKIFESMIRRVQNLKSSCQPPMPSSQKADDQTLASCNEKILEIEHAINKLMDSRLHNARALYLNDSKYTINLPTKVTSSIQKLNERAENYEKMDGKGLTDEINGDITLCLVNARKAMVASYSKRRKLALVDLQACSMWISLADRLKALILQGEQ